MTVIGRYAMFTCTYFTHKDALLGLRLCGGACIDSVNELHITEMELNGAYTNSDGAYTSTRRCLHILITFDHVVERRESRWMPRLRQTPGDEHQPRFPTLGHTVPLQQCTSADTVNLLWFGFLRAILPRFRSFTG